MTLTLLIDVDDRMDAFFTAYDVVLRGNRELRNASQPFPAAGSRTSARFQANKFLGFTVVFQKQFVPLRVRTNPPSQIAAAAIG
jgi:hypothetical protein